MYFGGLGLVNGKSTLVDLYKYSSVLGAARFHYYDVSTFQHFYRRI